MAAQDDRERGGWRRAVDGAPEPVLLDFEGPRCAMRPETFANFRFTARFTHLSTGREAVGLGHFMAHGEAGDRLVDEGAVWRLRFEPPEPGPWRYVLSFRRAPNIAAQVEAQLGGAVTPLDGARGEIVAPDAAAGPRPWRGAAAARSLPCGVLDEQAGGRRGVPEVREAAAALLDATAGRESAMLSFTLFRQDDDGIAALTRPGLEPEPLDQALRAPVINVSRLERWRIFVDALLAGGADVALILDPFALSQFWSGPDHRIGRRVLLRETLSRFGAGVRWRAALEPAERAFAQELLPALQDAEWAEPDDEAPARPGVVSATVLAPERDPRGAAAHPTHPGASSEAGAPLKMGADLETGADLEARSATGAGAPAEAARAAAADQRANSAPQAPSHDPSPAAPAQETAQESALWRSPKTLGAAAAEERASARRDAADAVDAPQGSFFEDAGSGAAASQADADADRAARGRGAVRLGAASLDRLKEAAAGAPRVDRPFVTPTEWPSAEATRAPDALGAARGEDGAFSSPFHVPPVAVSPEITRRLRTEDLRRASGPGALSLSLYWLKADAADFEAERLSEEAGASLDPLRDAAARLILRFEGEHAPLAREFRLWARRVSPDDLAPPAAERDAQRLEGPAGAIRHGRVDALAMIADLSRVAAAAAEAPLQLVVEALAASRGVAEGAEARLLKRWAVPLRPKIGLQAALDKTFPAVIVAAAAPTTPSERGAGSGDLGINPPTAFGAKLAAAGASADRALSKAASAGPDAAARPSFAGLVSNAQRRLSTRDETAEGEAAGSSIAGGPPPRPRRRSGDSRLSELIARSKSAARAAAAGTPSEPDARSEGAQRRAGEGGDGVDLRGLVAEGASGPGARPTAPRSAARSAAETAGDAAPRAPAPAASATAGGALSLGAVELIDAESDRRVARLTDEAVLAAEGLVGRRLTVKVMLRGSEAASIDSLRLTLEGEPLSQRAIDRPQACDGGQMGLFYGLTFRQGEAALLLEAFVGAPNTPGSGAGSGAVFKERLRFRVA